MGLIEDIERRLEYGDPCMKRLSELSIKDIVTNIEKIWENSGSASSISNKELIKEYHNKKTFVEYDSNLEIESIKIRWSYWDSITIELSSIGLIATYKPEHGSSIKLLDLTWVLVEQFFFKQ